MNDLERLNTRYEVVLEYNGEVVMDSKLASILRLVDEKGSLLSASRLLGIPYSRAWEHIVRAERILGVRLIETRRGGKNGGGTKLTKAARKLLEEYGRAEAQLDRCIKGKKLSSQTKALEFDLVIAYSHDPLLELVLSRLSDEGLSVEKACMGSGMSLAALSLGEVDIACVHLFDPDTKKYNESYLEKYWLKDRVDKLYGFKRELVFALRPGLRYEQIDEVLKDVLSGKLRIVNRNRGSGTRVFFDYLLNAAAERYGYGINALKSIRGYGVEVYSHLEAARYVAMGKADVALMLRHAAQTYGLRCLHVTWENYECFALKERLSKSGVNRFAETLRSKWFEDLVARAPGYRKD